MGWGLEERKDEENNAERWWVFQLSSNTSDVCDETPRHGVNISVQQPSEINTGYAQLILYVLKACITEQTTAGSKNTNSPCVCLRVIAIIADHLYFVCAEKKQQHVADELLRYLLS